MEKKFDYLEGEWVLHPKHHQRVIVHIDIDCFYAQVEMVRNPDLRNKPMGVKQKYLMVTSNYVARAMGVQKQMYVKEALKFLPELILIDGSDLTPYRQCSNEISSVAQTFTPHVERMGLDENFLDITDRVNECCDSFDDNLVGHMYGDKDSSCFPQSDPCGCGCYRRLIVGAHVASDLRRKIFESTGITCCAGIAHNKVIAKMVSGYHKPNQQTVIFPWQVCHLMESLDHVKRIPGIGNVTTKALEELNISSVQALQNADVKVLRTKFDEDTCRKLKNLAYGRDEALVRGSVRPQSLGIEDAFTVTKVTSSEIIKSKYEVLLERLLKLLASDGRRPSSLKVVVRKSDGIIKFGPRESKQMPLSPSLFSKGVTNISESCRSSLFKMILDAFHKMVDTSKPFCLTLVGLGFTKLIDQASESKSIVHFFKKRCHDQLKDSDGESRDQETHSHTMQDDSTLLKRSKSLITSEELSENKTERLNGDGLESNSSSSVVCDSQCSSTKFENQGDIKDTEVLNSTNNGDLLNFKEVNSYVSNKDLSSASVSSSESSSTIPDDIDRDVFNSLPREIQEEIISSYKANCISATKAIESPKTSEVGQFGHKSGKDKVSKFSLNGYFKPLHKQMENEFHCVENSKNNPSSSYSVNSSSCDEVTASEPSSSNSLTRINNDSELRHGVNALPKSIDLEVFSALPEELQREILDEEKKRKLSLSPRKLVEAHFSKKKSSASPSIMKYFKKS